jgi:hypothetical protein
MTTVNKNNNDKTVNKNNNDKTDINKKDDKFNIILIGLFILLYILLANKIADILSNSIMEENKKLETYTMYVYLIGIMGIVIAYFFIYDDINKGNHIINKGLTYGGLIILLYTIFFYWDYLGEYSKLSLLIISIMATVYYAYQ